MIRYIRFFVLSIFGLGVSCNTQSPVFTPDPKDPAYHCHDSSGAVIVDATWCFPVDGTHTCCYDNGTCIKPDPDGISRGCAYPNPAPNPEHEFGVRAPVSRMPE